MILINEILSEPGQFGSPLDTITNFLVKLIDETGTNLSEEQIEDIADSMYEDVIDYIPMYNDELAYSFNSMEIWENGNELVLDYSKDDFTEIVKSYVLENI